MSAKKKSTSLTAAQRVFGTKRPKPKLSLLKTKHKTKFKGNPTHSNENRVIASTPLVENDSIETDYIDIPMSEQQSTSADAIDIEEPVKCSHVIENSINGYEKETLRNSSDADGSPLLDCTTYNWKTGDQSESMVPNQSISSKDSQKLKTLSANVKTKSAVANDHDEKSMKEVDLSDDHPQTIAVCFHVLIPDDFKCKKSDQPVIILLEDRENMMYPLHVRDCGEDGYQIGSLMFLLPPRIYRHLNYKYAIFRGNIEWEKFHDHYDQMRNRLLSLDSYSKKTWDQIDFVMESPEAKEKYVRRMLNWVAGQNNLSRIQLNRLTALRYFLPDWHREQGFSSKLSPNKLRMSPTEVTAEIILVLRGYDDFLQQTMNHHLTEERSRLKNTVETYFQNIAEDAENFREQLPFHTLQTALTALTALSILSQKNIKIGTRLFATYFYLLRNSHVPDDHNGTIEVLTDFKSQYTNGNFGHKDELECIAYRLHQAFEITDFAPSILYAVPIYDLIQSGFGVDTVRIQSFFQDVYQSRRSVSNEVWQDAVAILKDKQHHWQSDPKFLECFLDVFCRRLSWLTDLQPEIWDYMPTLVLMSWLSNRIPVEKSPSFDTGEMDMLLRLYEIVTKGLRRHFKITETYIKKYDSVVTSFVDRAVNLLEIRASGFASLQNISPQIIQTCRVIDACLVHVKEADPSYYVSLSNKSTEWFELVGKLLQFFARKVGFITSDEVDAWILILSQDLQLLTQKYRDVVQRIFMLRLEHRSINYSEKIKLFVKGAQQIPNMKGFFEEQAVKSFNDASTLGELHHLHDLVTESAIARYGFSKAFLTQWLATEKPMNKNVLFNRIFSFPHIEVFWRVLNSSSDKTDFFPEALEVMKELTKCLEQFEASCLDLSITVDQLHAVTANRQNFLELLHVIQPDSMLTNRYLISLELGANEFRSVRAALRAVIGYVSDGGFEIKAKLQESESIVQMKSLVKVSHKSPNLDSIVMEYFDVSPSWRLKLRLAEELYDNHIFNVVVRTALERSNYKLLSLEDLLNQILSVALKEMRQVILDIHSQQIMLSTLDQLIAGNKMGKNTEIAEEFRKICDCLKILYETIEPGLELYRRYLSIRNSGSGAHTILKLVEKLNLKGNFEELRKVMALSIRTTTMKLGEISGTTVKCGDFLQGLTTDRVACIEALFEPEASELIDWISEKVERELQAFVDIAMTNVGENPAEHSIISTFNIAVSGYAPIVWLPKDSGMDNLHKVMTTLFASLARDPKLPEKLKISSRNLRRLQSYWEATGSLEKQSIEQVREINKYGQFLVGMMDPLIASERLMNETVKMVIKAPEMKEKDVSLSNLKDLHSRLMLIGGQMNEEQKAKEEISQFSDLFDEILKLKKLYRQHYKAGNVFFFNFQAIIFCDSMREISCLVFFKQSDIIRLRGVSGPKDSVKVLCKVMRDTLKEWKESVKKQRQHCPELNNFSNSQLVMLRRQLAELISTDVLQPETAMMLMSLSNNICAETLVKAARQCNSPIAGKGTFNGEIQSDIVVLDQLKGLGLSTRAALKIGRLTRWDRNAALEYAVNNSEQIEELENSIESGTADASDGRTVNDTISELLEQTTTTRGEMYDFELVAVWRKHIELQETTIVSHFLGIQRLGLILKEINSCSLTARRRIIPPWVKKGEVNFVVVPTADVLKYVLAAYVEDSTFPSSNEVLLCRSSTNEDDLMLFFDRMFQQREINQLYCVVFPERLASNICRQFEPLVERFLQVGGNGSLAMFSGQENFLKSPISGMWTNCHRTITNTATWDEVAKFVRRNIQTSTGNSPGKPEMLLTVYKANLVTSVGCGQGKSLLIQRQAEAVERLQGEGGVTYIKVPVYHSQVNVDLLVDLLMPHAAIPDYNKLNVRVIHIDFISNFAEIDEFLFELLVLGCISDSKGQIWRLLPQDLYAIEITSAVSRYLLPQIGDPQKPDDLQMFRFTLPTAVCLSPTDTLKIEERDKTCFNRQDVTPRTYDETELFSDSFQRCFYYLVTSTDPTVTLEFIPHIQAQPTVAATLMCLLTHIGIKEPSWMELKHFVDFLNVQLQDYESSDYCLPVLADDLPGFRQFVLSFLIEMAQDFATRSLKISEELADLNQAEVEQLEGYTIKRNWENQPHPYLFFNEDLGDVDRIRHTFSFFGCTFDQQGNLLIKGELYKLNFISPNLVRAFHRQKVNLQQDFEALPENEKLHLLQKVLGVPETEVSPDPNYQITADCAMKICAIHMRHRCNIPVCLMGETGCGKTRLIEFMYNLKRQNADTINLITYKVHGGTTFDNIAAAVENAIKLAGSNWRDFGIPSCLFFDEANSTEAMAMIKEILCDGTLRGVKLELKQHHLQLIAAVNPYRKHTDKMIEKLKTAGLGYHVDQEKVLDKFGEIPLRHLVYRVRPLPISMLSLVWDFGNLTDDIEGLYINRIVERFAQGRSFIEPVVGCLVDILKAAQKFMRTLNNECSFVSLRDVERTLTVIDWFYQHRDPIFLEIQKEFKTEKHQAEMATDDIAHAVILGISVCYRVSLQQTRSNFDEVMSEKFTGNLRLPAGPLTIAREIEMCQRVLINAVDLDTNVARNDALCENLFMMFICIELKIPLFLVGKPGSSKSLAKSIVATAMRGNASHSPLLQQFKQAQMFSYQCSPLATAEGVESVFRQGSSYQREVNLEEHVAVAVFDEIGLAEDSPRLPLKALHGLLEEGCQIAEEPLGPYHKISFIGISNWALDPAKMNRGIFVSRVLPSKDELLKTAKSICESDKSSYRFIEFVIEPLTNAYHEIYSSQHGIEFYGLRDFYSLMKMLYDMATKNSRKLAASDVIKAIQRNFSGYNETITRYAFIKHLQTVMDFEDDNTPTIPVVQLIEENLNGFPNLERDYRYLLILTENLAALNLLYKIPQLESATVIFGSNFRQDLEYTQICRSINRIKVCMDIGGTVVLLNLESLYESLYDLLNQAFINLGGERHVDLGLGIHRLKCHVNKKFRLVVIADRTEALNRFPVALINRLEKYFYTTITDMTESQRDLVKKLRSWVEDFVACKNKSFEPQDCFIGYHADAPATLVAEVFDRNKQNISLDDLFYEAKKLLIQCATPESIIRLAQGPLANEADDIFRLYSTEQYHSGLLSLLQTLGVRHSMQKKFFEITTHSRLMSASDFNLLKRSLTHFSGFHLHQLEEFETEVEFGEILNHAFQLGESSQQLLVIQCLSGNDSGGLLACAKYKIQEKLRQQPDASVFVLVLITLHRGSAAKNFIGLQAGLVESYHIDDIGDFSRPLEVQGKMSDYRGKKISELIKEFLEDPLAAPIDFKKLLKDSIHLTVSILADPSNRKAERIDLLSEILDSNNDFTHILMEFLLHLQIHKEVYFPTDWFSKLANDVNSILVNRTFKQTVLKKIENSVVPLFAGILSQIDVASNCSLLDSRNGSFQWQRNVFLELFGCKDLVDFRFQSPVFFSTGDYPQPLEKFSIAQLATVGFQCRFPFSWLLKTKIDEFLTTQEKIVRDLSNQNMKSHQEDMVIFIEQEDNMKSNTSPIADPDTILKQKPWGRVLVELSEDQLGHYLHDLVYWCFPTVTRRESELIIPWIWSLAENKTAMSLHKICQKLKPNVERFLSLIFNAKWLHVVQSLLGQPDILKDHHYATDYCAFVCVLETLENHTARCYEPVANNSLRDWLEEVQSSLPFMEAFLQDPSSFSSPNGSKARWQKVKVFYLFMLHTIHINYRFPVKGLWDFLSKSDFSSHKRKEFMKELDNVLKLWNRKMVAVIFNNGTNIKCGLCRESIVDPAGKTVEFLACLHCVHQVCLEQLRSLKRDQCPSNGCGEPISNNFRDLAAQKLRDAKTQYQSARQALSSFYMDLLETFVFRIDERPSSELIKMLMEHVTYVSPAKNIETTSLCYPVADDCAIDSTPVIRSFLLQLLLKYSSDDVSEHLNDYFLNAQRFAGDAANLSKLSLLCVTVLEDMEQSKVSTFPLEEKIRVAQRNWSKVGKLPQKPDVMSFEYLHRVADFRFAVSVYCEAISSVLSAKFSLNEIMVFHAQLRHSQVWELNGSAHQYVCKQLHRVYGNQTFMLASTDPSFSWIVPQGLKTTDDIDWSVIYSDYLPIKYEINLAITDVRNSVDFAEKFNKSRPNCLALLFMGSFYAGWTQQNADVTKFLLQQQSNLLSGSRLEKWADLLNRSVALRDLCGFHSYIPQLVSHTIASLSTANQNSKLTQFFQLLLAQPDRLNDSYFPTMPESYFSEVAAALKTVEPLRWYTCPNNHLYSIANCGLPMAISTCRECDAPIGGLHHTPLTGNRAIDISMTQDTTRKGHCLTSAQNLTLAPERTLNLQETLVLRALLHCCLLATSLRHFQEVSGLYWENTVDPLSYFKRQLDFDLQHLASHFHKNVDDIVVVLMKIWQNVGAAGDSEVQDPLLQQKNSRSIWERNFVDVFIKPVLENLNEVLAAAEKSAVNPEASTLNAVIYELVPSTPMASSLWGFRPRNTFEDIFAKVSQLLIDMNEPAELASLSLFVQNEQWLRPLRYLPSITRLQAYLNEHLRGFVDTQAIKSLPIREFLKDIGIADQGKVKDWIDDFFEAWKLCIPYLQNARLGPQGGNRNIRYKLPVDYLPSVGNYMDNSLLCLTPVDADAGKCSLALVEYLVFVQNSFVEEYRKTVTTLETAERPQDSDPNCCTKDSVIAYDREKDLMPLLLMHRVIQFEVGGDIIETSFDLPALQRRIESAFICNAHSFRKDKLFVLKTKESMMSEIFAQLREKKENVEINLSQKREILASVNSSLPEVHQSLELVELLLKFASSFNDYQDLTELVERLKLKKHLGFKEKVLGKLSTKELISLWQLMALQRNIMVLSAKFEEPFGDLVRSYGEALGENLKERLEEFLRFVDLCGFLCHLTEFILIHLPRGLPVFANNDNELIEYLEEFCPDLALPLAVQFPQDICLKHVIDVWKTAVERFRKARDF